MLGWMLLHLTRLFERLYCIKERYRNASIFNKKATYINTCLGVPAQHQITRTFICTVVE